jgi:hypothetical protein
MAMQVTLGDGDILDILDRIERQGQTMAGAAARYGVSRNVIAGVVFRVKKDLEISEAAPIPRGQVRAYRPDNQDGAMGPRWWEAGLRARAAQYGRSPARRVSA